MKRLALALFCVSFAAAAGGWWWRGSGVVSTVTDRSADAVANWFAITGDATNVYWSPSTATATKCILFIARTASGTTAPTGVGAVTLGTETPYNVFLDGNGNIYCTTSIGRIVKHVIADGASEVNDVVLYTDASAFGIRCAAVSGSNIIFTVDDTVVGQGEVRSQPIAGGASTILLSGQPRQMRGCSVQGSNFYFNDNEGGAIYSVPVGGGSRSTVASSLGAGLWGIVTDANNVYFSNRTDGTISKVALGGGSVTTLASSQNNPDYIGIDTSNIYWGTGVVTTGEIRGVPKTGGTVVVYSTGEDQPRAVWSDTDGKLFWTLYHVNKIRKYVP